MSDCSKPIGFRKTENTKVGGFTPAKKGMPAGVGIVKEQPKLHVKNQGGR